MSKSVPREEFNPDIEAKFEQLLRHMTDKNTTVQQFLRILREICDAEIFYSRSLDKFANNVSKLMVGKDPLKEVFIIFERAIAAKSEQSMELANSIKDDMIPFIQDHHIDLNDQNDLRGRHKLVRDMRAKMERKLRGLHVSEGSYRRAYEQLRRCGSVETRQEMEEKERAQRQFSEREAALVDAINSYNHTIEEYMLSYSAICEKLSDIETKRKSTVRDAINKFMIFEISYIKNIEYNVPRYMKSLEGMDERLMIQDRLNSNDAGTHLINLAKISVANYIANISDRQDINLPNSHKKILAIKKNTPHLVDNPKYHTLVAELNPLLADATRTYDIRVLKEVVYFAKSVCTLLSPRSSEEQQAGLGEAGVQMRRGGSEVERGGRALPLVLLDAVMCHPIFQSQEFWQKYQQKLMDIIYRQNKNALGSQSKEMQVSLSFLAADLEFLKIVAYHPLPQNILGKFKVVGDDQPQAHPRTEDAPPDPEFDEYLRRNKYCFE